MVPVTQVHGEEVGLEIQGEGWVFFSCLFIMSVWEEKKWLFVHKWSSFSCGSAEEDILDVAASAAGRKCSSSPCSEDERNLPPPPPRGGQCATVKSRLLSIHIAEVLFDFYKKIRYNLGQRSLKARRPRWDRVA